MRCPRCEGPLATFAVERSGRKAVVCESCGFSGIPASHRPEAADVESWEQAIERFDETVLPPERTCRTGRTGAVPTPRADSGPTIDPARLEESVSVATSLRANGSDGSETDPEEWGDLVGANDVVDAEDEPGATDGSVAGDERGGSEAPGEADEPVTGDEE